MIKAGKRTQFAPVIAGLAGVLGCNIAGDHIRAPRAALVNRDHNWHPADSAAELV